MPIRNALRADAEAIQRLIAAHVSDGSLLPRTVAEIRREIRDFVVAEDGGAVVGCGALHLYGPHLAEIRSITVRADYRGLGLGRAVVKALLRRANRRDVLGVCLFTRAPGFFAAFGFEVVDRKRVPEKFHKDCRLCPRRYACDEIAMAMGELSIPATSHQTVMAGNS
ncbi:MAG TPA: GNAT family N-acetyltransferase [Candidatus Krumholzibacteria bacterium]|nr:GNAT family N-acetyltransferase [Candidatus Krumholzibacteria bacterium]